MPIDPITSINSNTAADRVARLASEASLRLQKSIARFSAGLRITSPADDAGGLSQFMTLDSQLSRISAADTNANNAVSFSQTQDGFLQQAQGALNRMSELSVLAQDGTKTDADRAAYQAEFSQLQEMVSDLGGQKFNDVNLFSSSDLTVTTGPDGETADLRALDVNAAGSSGGLADVSSLSIATANGAAAAVGTLKTAIENVASFRATTGASMQRLHSTRDNLGELEINLSAAASRIADADLAAESSHLAAAKTQVQSSMFQLAGANRAPKSILQLLA